ncbi:hypothetical protein P691DRAFT_786046 [Macrolepiota fuliginosa MF-IS2]|uniref:Uncharacterized protein n=1 Tax=Macrolepiota fuliginosa MF-IS2 TaxID=1400762 RepID=A0A9P5X801_9AGAR|nr:hypothetical protein P691DRAFT_786046 [Macrolepiota fuliginosa MF-IS2]
MSDYGLLGSENPTIMETYIPNRTDFGGPAVRPGAKMDIQGPKFWSPGPPKIGQPGRAMGVFLYSYPAKISSMACIDLWDDNPTNIREHFNPFEWIGIGKKIFVNNRGKRFTSSLEATALPDLAQFALLVPFHLLALLSAPLVQAPLDSLKPLEIKWDTTLLDTRKTNVYLYAPAATLFRVAIWQNVDFTAGSVTVDLMPRWWNSSASTYLQLGIVPSGQSLQLFMPYIWQPPSCCRYVDQDEGRDHRGPKLSSDQTSHMSDQQPAAAVLIPLLLIIGCVIGLIRWQCKQATQKPQQLSVAVDERVASLFSFGGIRPAYGFALDGGAGNQASIGARQMLQMRTGVGLRNPPSIGGERGSRESFVDGVRQSRVSFANDPRRSRESRCARAFHHDYVPLVPSIPAGVAAAFPSDEDGALSPRQTHGPLALTPEDICAHIVVLDCVVRPIINRYYSTKGRDRRRPPALSITAMRTDQGKDYLLPAPAPAHTPCPTSVNSFPATNNDVAASIMSPDEMLYADAERRSNHTMTPVNGVSYPMPVASPVSPTMPMPMPMSPPPTMAVVTLLPMSPVNMGNGVRPLFGPMDVMSQTNTGNGYGRKGSVVVRQYGGARYEIGEDEDAYGGTA